MKSKSHEIDPVLMDQFKLLNFLNDEICDDTGISSISVLNQENNNIWNSINNKRMELKGLTKKTGEKTILDSAGEIPNFVGHETTNSAATVIKKRSSIWDAEDNKLLEKKKMMMVPPPDRFCIEKKRHSDESFKSNMSDLSSVVKCCSNMFVSNLKLENGFYYYGCDKSLKVFLKESFEILDLSGKNKLMRDMLSIINLYK